jgi:hypothetical protein
VILLREMVKINFDLKKKHLLLFVGIIFIIGLGFVLAAIPNPGHGPSQVSIGGGKNLSDVTGQLIAIANGDYITVGSGLSVTQIGSQLNISLASGGGGITNVIAGIGLFGGGTTSTVTLNANCTAILGHTCGTDNVGLTVEADPKVGNTTNNLWCVGNGTAVICNRTAPTGSGGSSQWTNITGGGIYYNGGNVGIGTTSPGAQLQIGSRTVDSVGIIRVASKSGTPNRAWDFGVSPSYSYGFYIKDNDQTNPAFFIDYANNNVGIGTGTTTPVAKLHVLNSVDGEPTAVFENDQTDASEKYTSIRLKDSANWYSEIRGVRAGNLAFVVGGGSAPVEAMRMLSNGYVGIGTTGPTARLDVYGGPVDSVAAGIRGTVFGFGTTGATGVVGVSHGLQGKGVIGTATQTGGIGVQGSGVQFDFYASGMGTNYGPFTGSHEAKLATDFPKEFKKGLIVSVTGKNEIRKDENGTVSLSSTLPTVQLSNKVDDRAIIGVITSEASLPEDHWYKSKPGERFGIINALGDGRVWVSNVNGEISAGDYITSSQIRGYGQKQDDDLLHTYTVGKATENVDWSKVSETVEFNGKKYKVYLIGVVYTSG